MSEEAELPRCRERVCLDVVLGICTMERKARGKSMNNLLSRLRIADDIPVTFEIIYFEDDLLLNKPVEEWPICDCLVCFHTHHFPIDKAVAYVELRKPIVLNDVGIQKNLLDRQFVYQTLVDNQVPVSPFVVVDHLNGEDIEIIEEDEYIEIQGHIIMKPFVEKPVNAENHEIHIYYPIKNPYKGGVTKLFRKCLIDGVLRSSQYFPEPAKIRRKGAFIYEQFLSSGGVDLKAYTVGPEYVHAEARKAPGVDGFVDFDQGGHELRYPIILSALEKAMIARTVKAFKQNVCGIDILRTPMRSYVVDVNGWSFVKNGLKYYDDAAWILRRFFYDECLKARKCVETPRIQNIPTKPSLSENINFKNIMPQKDNTEELRAVLAFFRHGDITPRDKLKTLVVAPRLAKFLGSETMVTFRSKPTLRKVLAELEASEADIKNGSKEVFINEDHLKTILSVLRESKELVSHCKVQLRRIYIEEKKEAVKDIKAGEVEKRRHSKIAKGSPDELIRSAGETKFDEAMWVIVKWGGQLTVEGDEQAVNFGKEFRSSMYPIEEGVLRLHATYRHDLKIYTTEESRDIATAAAFAKGLLCLRGSVSQVAANCIAPRHGLLDGTNDTLRAQLKAARKRLEDYISSNSDDATFFALDCTQEAAKRLIDMFGSLASAIRTYMPKICAMVSERAQDEELKTRWGNWLNKFDAEEGEVPATSKVVSFFWAIQHDLIHHRDVLEACLGTDEFEKFFSVIDDVARCLVPQEFGKDEEEKNIIARGIARKITARLVTDFTHSMYLEPGERKSSKQADFSSENEDSEDSEEGRYALDVERLETEMDHINRSVRTRLYFMRKSQLLAFSHLLMSLPLPEKSRHLLQISAHNLSYLANIAFVVLHLKHNNQDCSDNFKVKICYQSSTSISSTVLGELTMNEMFKWLRECDAVMGKKMLTIEGLTRNFSEFGFAKRSTDLSI